MKTRLSRKSSKVLTALKLEVKRLTSDANKKKTTDSKNRLEAFCASAEYIVYDPLLKVED